MPIINGKFYTDEEVEAIRRQSSSEQFERFLVSGVIGFATGSTIVGAVLGGDIIGALVGDLLEGTDDSIF
jgi:hypothetical protein